MKNYLILLIVVLFISASTSAQPYKNEDTVVVFQTSTPVPGMINKYLLFKEGNEFGWVDSNYILHKSKISKITAGFLLVDADTVFPADVKSLVLSGPAAFMPSKNQERTVPVKSDTIQSFRVMSYQEFEKLSKTEFIIEAKQHNDPFYKHISAEKYAAEMDKKIQRRNNMFAALDTCPLHYGIKTNIAKDLTNEFNLSFELPIKRDLCIDIGVGVLIPLDFFGPYPATVLTQISEFRDRHITWFDHSYLIRKGFSVEMIPKFFLTKKKHLYLGPQLYVRYHYYKNEWIFVNADGSDYYHRRFEALQSEKSATVQLNALFGVQSPQIKRFIFDAFVSLGIMYRGGVITRTQEVTYYHEGSRRDFYDPPLEYTGGGIMLSGQIGIRIGWRFGKAKLYG